MSSAAISERMHTLWQVAARAQRILRLPEITSDQVGCQER
jgi:hypothetical protein